MMACSSKKKYPYQDLSLKDMKGEKWEEIPFSEGYYLLSNYGRLKALSRIIETNGHIRYTKDKILKLRVQKNRNDYIGDSVYILIGAFVFNKQPFHFSVRRLMYELFVQPVTKESMKRKLVFCKDGDGFNTRISNLELKTVSDMRITTIRTNRGPSIRHHLTPKIIRKAILLASRNKRRKVKQFLPDGKFIKEYRSITIAARKTGNSITSISDCASGKRLFTKGCVWRFENDPYHGQHLQQFLKKMPKEIVQYDIAGKRVGTFVTFREAERQTGIYAASIRRCVQRIGYMAGGFVWRYSDDSYTGEYSQRFKRKRIIQFDIKGKKIAVFDTMLAAALNSNSSRNGISQALLKNQKTCNGFLWKYEGDL